MLIQWRWIAGTIALKDQQFSEHVDNALVAVTDRLERIEAMEDLRGNLPGQRMIRYLDSLEVNEEAGTRPPATPIGPEVAHSERDSLLNDLVRGLFSGEAMRGIEERLDPQLLDSLIRDELKRRGIAERYEFGVFGPAPDPVLVQLVFQDDAKVVRESSHRARLFRNDVSGEAYWLHVHLPDQKRFVLRSMQPMLLSSALFVLLIIAAFVYTLRTIWHQKRLGDIKNDLVNNLTHELKTPISTIALACEALNDPGIPKSPEQVKLFTNMIRDENKRLGLLVESVLQSAVTEGGRMRLRLVDVDLHAVLTEVVRNNAISAQNRGGRLQLETGAALAHVRGDRTHLANVFYNLIDNAVKYCEREPVIAIGTRSDEKGITVSVRDNGIGIPRAEQKKIFDRLYRVPTGDRHNVKGFGLGLSYVKAVVEQHGGSIRLESEPGTGSTFLITIPFEHG